ncbi:hypothetical protein ABH973_000701 [Bradyrhizobium ottawaense]
MSCNFQRYQFKRAYAYNIRLVAFAYMRQLRDKSVLA